MAVLQIYDMDVVRGQNCLVTNFSQSQSKDRMSNMKLLLLSVLASILKNELILRILLLARIASVGPGSQISERPLEVPVHVDVEHWVETAARPGAHPGEEVQVEQGHLGVNQVHQQVRKVADHEDEEDRDHHPCEHEILADVALRWLNTSLLVVVGCG